MGIRGPLLQPRFAACVALVVCGAWLYGAPAAFADGALDVSPPADPAVSVPPAPAAPTVSDVSAAVPTATAPVEPVSHVSETVASLQSPAPALVKQLVSPVSPPRPANERPAASTVHAMPPRKPPAARRSRPTTVPTPSRTAASPVRPQPELRPPAGRRASVNDVAGPRPPLTQQPAPGFTGSAGAVPGSSGIVILLLAIALGAFALMRPRRGGRIVPFVRTPRSVALVLALERPD